MIISIIIFIFAFYFYSKNKIVEMLLCITFLLTNGYQFLNKNLTVIKPSDFVLILLLWITVKEYIHNRTYLNVKGDNVGKIIALILLYCTFEYLRTILLDIETSSFALKVVRVNIVFLSYFYIRRLPYKVVYKFFTLNLCMCIIQGIFFYLQFIGFTGILSGYVQEGTTSAELSRYGNYPIFAAFYILYFVVNDNIMIGKRVFFIVFFGMMPILGMMRGQIMGLALALILYFAFLHKSIHITYMAVGYIIYVFLIAPMFAYRDSQASHNGSTFDDIENVLTAKSFSSIESDGGTFTFRVAMLSERWNYLSNNPQYIPFGVGLIHEESSNNRFHFIVGTLNKETKYGHCMIESGDITWVPILLRYGIVGTFSFLLLFVVWIKEGISCIKTNKAVCIVASLLSLYFLLTSLDGAMFESYMNVFLVSFYLAIISIVQQKDLCMQNK